MYELLKEQVIRLQLELLNSLSSLFTGESMEKMNCSTANDFQTCIKMRAELAFEKLFEKNV